MTAYLQPGDKIHLSIPGSVTGEWDQDRANALRNEYELNGVDTFLVTSAEPGSPVEVVSVIRRSTPMIPPVPVDPVE
jgi:hypothetical protein